MLFYKGVIHKNDVTALGVGVSDLMTTALLFIISTQRHCVVNYGQPLTLIKVNIR